MHFSEYNIVCSKCDRLIEYEELGRSIIITPCPCQTVELVEALRMAIAALQDNDIDESMAGEFEILTDALANATK